MLKETKLFQICRKGYE